MFIHSLERDDFFNMYAQYYFMDYAVLYIFFTQKWASLYSSFWIRFSSPQASGKETTLLSLPTLSTYQLIMLHNNISVINATPLVTRRPFPLWLMRKNLCQLLAVMYLTSAPQQQLDDFCNGALTELLFHIFSQLPISGSLLMDWSSSLRWNSFECSTSAVPFSFKVKGALNESSMLETAVRPQEFYSIHRLYTLCAIGIRVIVLSILIPVRAIFVAP